jgi:hypothetical protein
VGLRRFASPTELLHKQAQYTTDEANSCSRDLVVLPDNPNLTGLEKWPACLDWSACLAVTCLTGDELAQDCGSRRFGNVA